MTAPTPGTPERKAYDRTLARLTHYAAADALREAVAVSVLQSSRSEADTIRLAVLDAVLDHDQAEQDRNRAALDEVIASVGTDAERGWTPIATGTAGPACRAGEHTACSGDGWDAVRDEPIVCGCTCHAAAP